MELHTLTVVRHTERFEAMSRFYGEVLGMSAVETWNRPDGRGTVFAPAGSVRGAHIEVLDMPGATVAETSPANIVLTLLVADVRAVHDGLLGAGATVARGVEDTPWGYRSIGLDDPDGLRIWIVEELAEA